jgi:hypothetical protein
MFAARRSKAASIASRSLSAWPIVTVRSTPSFASNPTSSGAPRVAAWIMYKMRGFELLKGNCRSLVKSANFGLTGNPNILIFSGATPADRKTEALCSFATRK